MKTTAYTMGWMVLAAALCGAAARPIEPAELLAKAKSGEETSRLKAIGGLGQRGATIPGSVELLTELLKDPSAKIQARAADALGDLGPAAKSAAPSLTKLVDDPQAIVRREAIRALLRMEPDAKALRELVAKALKEKEDRDVRLVLMRQVAELGKKAVPALIEGLKDPAEEFPAVLVLSDLGPAAAEAVPGLMEKAKPTKYLELRREAIVALGAIGSASAPAVPVLLDAMNDPAFALTAAFSLGQIGPAAKQAEGALAKAEQSGDAFQKVVAAWALARIRPRDQKRLEKSTAALLAAAADKDPAVRAAALRGLANLRPKPEQVLPAIAKIMQAADKATADKALKVLGGIGEPAVPQLLDALKLAEQRRAVCNILASMGPAAKAAVPALLDVSKKDPDPNVREESLLAIAAIGPSPEAIALAQTALNDADEDVAYSACYLLGAAGKAAKSSEAALEAKLTCADPVLRFLAAWALANIDASNAARAPKLVPILAKGLNEGWPRHRQEAAEALGSLGPAAKAAIPALKNTEKDRDAEVRKAVAEALRQIGS